MVTSFCKLQISELIYNVEQNFFQHKFQPICSPLWNANCKCWNPSPDSAILVAMPAEMTFLLSKGWSVCWSMFLWARRTLRSLTNDTEKLCFLSSFVLRNLFTSWYRDWTSAIALWASKDNEQWLKILCLLQWTPALLWDASHQKIYNYELSTGMVPWASAMISSGITPQPVELFWLDENYKREFFGERWAYSLMMHWVIYDWLEGCKPQMHLPHQLLQFAEFWYQYLSKMRNFIIVFIHIITVSLLTGQITQLPVNCSLSFVLVLSLFFYDMSILPMQLQSTINASILKPLTQFVLRQY